MDSKELNITDKNINSIVKELLPDNKLSAFIQSGSKRIRSKLAINFVKAYGKSFDETLYGILTACELIHNASLLHDDVIDDSDKRRGISTIGKVFSPDISILCGDYLVSEAVGLLININNNIIMNKFNECVKNMSVAEIRQYFLRGKTPSLEEYIEICKGKTAGLFSTLLYCCALHTNLDLKFAADFGEWFGIYFQIKNDLEINSSNKDKKNMICTAADILGIEKAHDLLDNYKEKLNNLLQNIPENEYRFILESIVKEL